MHNLQGLMPADLLARVNVYRYFVERSAEHFFVSLVFFTNETRFGRDGTINIHNQHQWEQENPHGVILSRHQQQFSINLRAGICC
jgi:hypothetical protein